MNFIVIDDITIKTVSAHETFCDKLLKHKGVWSHEFLDWIGAKPLNPIEQLKQMNEEN